MSHQFSSKVIAWYNIHQRDLPWRRTKNPYLIWLSEIILQQTQVKQGLPYYQRFAQTYPSVYDLAAAKEEDVMRLWQGLGYYSRARNMHFTAQEIVSKRSGKFPTTYKELLKLKGVGSYTAAAIASFAFGENVAVVDGNVFRLLARFFGIKTDILSTQGKKEFAELANSLLPHGQAGVFNQAIMEFGSKQCKPAKPLCTLCTLQDRCYAFSKKLQATLPVKIKKTKIKTRFFQYLVFEYDKKLMLKKRVNTGIWRSLYDFQLIETDKQFLNMDIILNSHVPHGFDIISCKQSDDFKHLLSHQKLRVRFFYLKLKQYDEQIMQDLGLRLYNADEVEALPKPVLIDNYLKQRTNNNDLFSF